MLYVNTNGEIGVTLKLIKDSQECIFIEDLTGDYEDMEVNTVEEALEDIRSNIELYFSSLSSLKKQKVNGMDDKSSYVGAFADYFNIDFSEAIEKYYDLEIKVIDIDTSKLNIEIEE